jgi:hypothetical protein
LWARAFLNGNHLIGRRKQKPGRRIRFQKRLAARHAALKNQSQRQIQPPCGKLCGKAAKRSGFFRSGKRSPNPLPLTRRQNGGRNGWSIRRDQPRGHKPALKRALHLKSPPAHILPACNDIGPGSAQHARAKKRHTLTERISGGRRAGGLQRHSKTFEPEWLDQTIAML